ncbi:MAG: GTP 3',8-cyclase MoaA, partial [Burkholderiaceae bacterium]|nr:GTP 3',8-cyclase MoaA [Burkholderiaceae bacterium]
GIDSAIEAGLYPIKINMVVMPGVNEDEIDAMFQFCRNRGLTFRMIETMPMGHTALEAGTVSLHPY